MNMDDAMELAVEMSSTTWNAFTTELKDLSPDEISWLRYHRRTILP
jgi:hypothetical protein